MRREYRRRRRNFYSVSDDEVEYGPHRQAPSRTLRSLTRLSFRARAKPKVYATATGATSAPITPPKRATSAGPEVATAPNLSHLPPVIRTGSAEAWQNGFLHPHHAYAHKPLPSRPLTAQHTGHTGHLPTPVMSPRRRSSTNHTPAQRGPTPADLGIPEDYGNAQFAKEEKWRAKERRRLEKEEERERRDMAYDREHYGPDAYNPYTAQV